MENSIQLVSVGRHTRIGDVLGQALEGLSFRTAEIETIGTDAHSGRVLFAVSADATGINEPVFRLAARLRSGECRLDGAVCAVIADGEQGGKVQTDALRLLLAANGAGALCLPNALLESRRDLKPFSDARGAPRKTPFEAYVSHAKSLAKRLSDFKAASAEPPRVRVLSPLTGGAVKDWRAALSRFVAEAGGCWTDELDAEYTILLTENTTGLPDERTLSLLKRGSGRLTCFAASPATGGELYALALFDQACARGGFALAPEGMLIFEGMSAVEVLASKAEMERIRDRIAQGLRRAPAHS